MFAEGGGRPVSATQVSATVTAARPFAGLVESPTPRRSILMTSAPATFSHNSTTGLVCQRTPHPRRAVPTAVHRVEDDALVSLLERDLALLPDQIAEALYTSEDPVPMGSGISFLVPYQATPTADGHLIVAAGNDRLCHALGLCFRVDGVRSRPTGPVSSLGADTPSFSSNRGAAS